MLFTPPIGLSFEELMMDEKPGNAEQAGKSLDKLEAYERGPAQELQQMLCRQLKANSSKDKQNLNPKFQFITKENYIGFMHTTQNNPDDHGPCHQGDAPANCSRL